tara:strand:+ start:1200 stop:1352 length:153 start_codon:yes stop_codon:yes gene_type:complete
VKEDEQRPWLEIPAPDYLPSTKPGSGGPCPSVDDAPKAPEEVERVIIIDL